MTKRFCDKCGELSDTNEKAGIKISAPGIGANTKIVARVDISFEGHPTGFGGPPDLCSGCKLDILKELVESRRVQSQSNQS